MKNKTSPIQTTGASTMWMRIILSVLVLLIYGQTANFEYTLDDDVFYQKHASVQDGFSGIGEIFSLGSMEKFDGTTGVQPYRPITLLWFAVEKEFFNNNPVKSHWINVLLYIFVLQILLTVLLKLMSAEHTYVIMAAVFLFALHPVHTEVVASVKSRDELLVAFFGLMAWSWFLKLYQTDSLNGWQRFFPSFVAAAFLLLCLMSKENGIAFMAVLPLSAVLMQKISIKKVALFSIPLLVATLFFLVVRTSIVGTVSAHRGIDILDNTLYATGDLGENLATKMEILFQYLKLLFLPWPLSWDYSFAQLPVMNWSDVLPWASLVIHAGLLLIAILLWKKQPSVAFFILFYFICSAPTNNFFFNNGATVAERFLFTPSLSFVVIMAMLSSILLGLKKDKFSGASSKIWLTSIMAICLTYTVLSHSRTADWENNFALFKSGAEACPNSSRANQALATAYENKALEETDPVMSRAYTDSALQYFKKSIAILPGNADATFKMAQICEKLGKREEAKKYYRESVKYKPSYYVALNNLGALYASEKNWDSALHQFELAYRADAGIEMTLTNLMVVHFNKGQFDRVVRFGEEALKLGYNNQKVMNLLQEARRREGFIP